MLPVPMTGQLAAFSGRASDSYGPFASEALAQATLLFTLRTHLTEMPTDPDLAKLAGYAILQMADRIYLEQPNAAVLSSPYQSETIGSYSYSKGSIASKAQDGISTGLFWWDLAMDQLATVLSSTVSSGSVQVFYGDIVTDSDGMQFVLGPADLDTEASARADTPI